MIPKWLLAAVALTLGVAAVSVAQVPPPHRPPPHPDDLLRDHADELGIDDDALEAITAIADSVRAQRDVLVLQMRAAHEELFALLSASEPDRDAVMEQLEVIGQAETALRQLEIGGLLDMRAYLTPEQWAALQTLEDSAGERIRPLHPPPRGLLPPPGGPGGPARP